ncbi:hypothetical protein Hanom_Chr11g01035141 [Helianthus anomalus]
MLPTLGRRSLRHRLCRLITIHWLRKRMVGPSIGCKNDGGNASSASTSRATNLISVGGGVGNWSRLWSDGEKQSQSYGMEHLRYTAPAPFSGKIRFLIGISTHDRVIYRRGEVMVTVTVVDEVEDYGVGVRWWRFSGGVRWWWWW